MSTKHHNSIALPDRGSGNDPDSLGLAFQNQGSIWELTKEVCALRVLLVVFVVIMSDSDSGSKFICCTNTR